MNFDEITFRKTRPIIDHNNILLIHLALYDVTSRQFDFKTFGIHFTDCLPIKKNKCFLKLKHFHEYLTNASNENKANILDIKMQKLFPFTHFQFIHFQFCIPNFNS